MSDAYIQVAADGSGKKIQTYNSTVNTADVHAQAVVLVNSSGTPYLPVISPLTSDINANSHFVTNAADPVNPQDLASKNYVDSQIAAISGSGFTGVITGCGVVWTTLLNFTVSAGTYSINGTTYTLAQTNLTLSAADPTNPRFDVIAANTSSAAVVIIGTAAANPSVPTVDPATQLMLTIVYVPAGATSPGNITSTTLYAENAGSPTEWDSSTNSAGTINLASTNNPHLGTKCIEGTSVVAGNSITLQKGSGTIDLSTQNSLVFYIRSKATWPSQKSITISFLNAGTQQGNAITFQNGSFGFTSSNTTSYQQIVIPLSAFNIGNSPVNQLKLLVAGSGPSIGFYLDDITLQAGVVVGVQTFMLWRGTYSATTAYRQNDVVINNGVAYVLIVVGPVTGQLPTSTNTNWQAISSIPRTFSASVDGANMNIVAGFIGYYTTNYSGKITGWSITAKGTNPTETFDIWKIATGTSVPTASNTITGGSGNRPGLSTGNALRSTNMTNWTVNFSTGDVFGFNLDATTNTTWTQIIVETIQQ